MTDAEMLNATASALYGAHWQNALARALDINERTVRRWASGEAPVPAGVWLDISEIIGERIIELHGLRKTMRH
jgi:DNA-binding transcriptional regulator YdaS (Cro superfamily)